jgi:hypothetical protein
VLEPGERLLWSGRPGFRRRRSETIGGALALLPVVPLALASRHDGAAALFAAGFAIAALWWLVLRPWDRATLAYGVTDRRVLFVHRGWRRGIDEYALAGMSAANVLLGANTVRFADFAKWCGYDNDELCMPEFLGLPDAWDVVRLTRAQIADAGGTPWPGRDDGQVTDRIRVIERAFGRNDRNLATIATPRAGAIGWPERSDGEP